MSLLTPVGLSALAGIALIIIIYIIKSRYEEHAISSTYIWTLSKKFQKNRVPLSSFNRILALILLILMFIILAIILSTPLITVEGGATEYVVMIDGSCSMQMKDEEGLTRFEKAITQTEELADSMTNGSIMHVIFAGESAMEVVTSEDPEEVKLKLKSLKPITTGCDEVGALELAQKYFRNNPGVNIKLFTDCNQEIENVEVVNLSTESDFNVSILDLTYAQTEEGFDYTATVGSFGKPCTAFLSIKIDGRLRGGKSVSVGKDEEQEVVFSLAVSSFSSAEVRIEYDEFDREFVDSFEADNVCEVRMSDEKVKKILVCGAETYFLSSMLNAIGGYEVEYADSYERQSGYDLYILDRPTAETRMPTDGAIWTFSPETSVSDVVYVIDGNIVLADELEGSAGVLAATDSVGTAGKILAPRLSSADIAVSKLKRLFVKISGDIVFEVNSHPAVVGGASESGLRTLTFAFDIHDSDLPLRMDFLSIFRGSLNYLLPVVGEVNCTDAGRPVRLTVLPLCESMYLDAPSGKMVAFDATADSVSTVMKEIGMYTVTEYLSSGTRYFNIYCHPAKAEINFSGAWIGAVIETSSHGKEEVKIDEKVDPSIYFVGFLMLVLLGEWVVHCREQY